MSKTCSLGNISWLDSNPFYTEIHLNYETSYLHYAFWASDWSRPRPLLQHHEVWIFSARVKKVISAMKFDASWREIFSARVKMAMSDLEQRQFKHPPVIFQFWKVSRYIIMYFRVLSKLVRYKGKTGAWDNFRTRRQTFIHQVD